MSLQFSETAGSGAVAYKGIIQIIEKELGFPRAYISGNTDRLKDFTADVNLTVDDYVELAIKSSGKFQYDDSNHTTYPILTGNLVAGQRDYSFTEDSDGNLILEIYRVFVRSSTTSPYYEIFPLDVQSDRENDITKIADGLNTQGQPTHFDATGTGLFLDPIPSASVTSGLKVYVNREGSYFTSTDTTKEPGAPGVHHEYFALKPAMRYARRNNLSVFDKLQREVIKFEGDDDLGIIGKIQRFFSRRARFQRNIMTGKRINYI